MKIFNCVFGDATGGRWQAVLNYNQMLAMGGHQVLMITAQGVNPVSAEVQQSVNHLTIKTSGHYDLLAAFKLWRLIKREKPDAIICHCSRSLAIFKLASGKIPIVGVAHNDKIRRIISADYCFNISDEITRLMCEAGFNPERIVKIPNVVRVQEEYQRFQPRPLSQPLQLGALGRFVQQKGFDVLLDALKLLRDQGHSFHLRLLGDGEDKAKLQSTIARHKLADCVSMEGWTREPWQFYQQVDAIIMPSRWEGFAITPIEVALTSTPLFLSDIPSFQEFSHNGEWASLHQTGKAESLCQSLLALWQNPDQLTRKARHCHQQALERYEIGRVARRLDQALKSITGGQQ